MAITSLSRTHVQEIEEILAKYSPILTPSIIDMGLKNLQGPILEYVNKYVPEEYNSEFQYMDTWESMIKDVMDRGSLELPGKPIITISPSSSVTFDTSSIVSPVKSIIGDLPIKENIPAYMGPLMYFKDTRMSFRNRVAIILTILMFLNLLMTNDSYKESMTNFAVSESDSFVQKVITGYMSREDESLKKKDFYGNTIG